MSPSHDNRPKPNMSSSSVRGIGPRRSRRMLAAGAAVTAAAVAGGVFAAQRHITRQWRATEEALAAAGLVLSDDLVHHEVPTSDGGTVHAVEIGEGPPIVLVHGVTHSVAVWVRQLAALTDRHRVIAIDLRGHGGSVAGDNDYSFDRLADDVLDVLDALSVRDAVLVGHSMGGMVSLAAVLRTAIPRDPGRQSNRHPNRKSGSVSGLVLVGTTAGPVTRASMSPLLTGMLTSLARRSLISAERHGRGLFPGEDLASWSTRLSFGSKPTPLDLELTRSMITTMSPATMAELLVSLMGFDVRSELHRIELPTRVVAGSRDLLLPPVHSRRLAAGIPGAELQMLGGCGHMVMLERADELNMIVDELSAEVQVGTATT